MGAVRALYVCCYYDEVGLISPIIFEKLLPQLVAQLEEEPSPEMKNIFAREEEVFVHKNLLSIDIYSRKLVYGIGQMAIVTSYETHWRHFIHLVLSTNQKTTLRSKMLRIEVIEIIFNRLSGEFMIILQEILPYLSELLGGESSVQKKCHTLIKKLETIL